MKNKIFANGFDSWMESFYEIVEYITLERQKSNETELHQKNGAKGFWNLAEKWADEFEDLNKGINWENRDFHKEIQQFCEKKNL